MKNFFCWCLLGTFLGSAPAAAQIRVLKVNQSGAVRIALPTRGFNPSLLHETGWLEPLSVYARWAARVGIAEERDFWARIDLSKAQDRALLAPLAAQLGRDEKLQREMSALREAAGPDAALAVKIGRAKAESLGLIRPMLRQVVEEVVYKNGAMEPEDAESLRARRREVEAARFLALKLGIYGRELFEEEEGWISEKLGQLRRLQLAVAIEPRLRALSGLSGVSAAEAVPGTYAAKPEPAPAPAKILESWPRISRREAERFLAEGGKTEYRFDGIHGVMLEDSRPLVDLALQGLIEVYRKPGGGSVFTLAAGGSLARMSRDLDRYVDQSRRMSREISQALTIFKLMIHSPKVGITRPDERLRIKESIKNEALAKVSEAIAKYHAASLRWYEETSRFRSLLSGQARILAGAVLSVSQPQAAGGMALQQAEDIVLINMLILDRPEILSVDSDALGGIEIELDVAAGVGRLKTMPGYEKELKDFLKGFGIATPVRFIFVTGRSAA